MPEPPKLGGQLQALAREAAKDAQNTLNQIFFGQPSTPSEPGTPLAPTQQMVSEQVTGKVSLAEIMQAGKDVEQARQKQQEMER